ncbi:MAG: DUF368 domain-containing protein [Planctomycetota bacterium]|nr:DUF368 domain-containing protein [Planctomycetota bacterium]
MLGGALMGLANLVPGISGGTMILAVGLYDRFIDSVADVTRLRLRRPSVVFLGAMAIGLAAAVLLGSGVAVRLVVEHRWAMYALFVGMTLGGAPELWRLARPHGAGVLAAVAVGFGAMALFAFGAGESALEPTIPVLLAVGAAGAASMILPGISGSYVLLILGMYDTVIGALSLSEVRESPRESLMIVGPVVIGAGLGIALLSNVLKALLRRFSGPSHGVLLGLLLGSILGLYPFQESVHPELAHTPTRKAIEAVVLDGEPIGAVAAAVEGLDSVALAGFAERWSGSDKSAMKRASLETRRFDPSVARALQALGLFVLGVMLTRLLGRSSAGSEDA